MTNITTPLGKGRIVYKLPDGTYLVEFPHGGGRIFLAEELWGRLPVQAQNRDFDRVPSEAGTETAIDRSVLVW